MMYRMEIDRGSDIASIMDVGALWFVLAGVVVGLVCHWLYDRSRRR